MDEASEHDSCSQEVETLKAIFEGDLQIEETESGRPECLTIKILPATGDDRSKQYVCLTLILHLPAEYPHVPPEISVRNPRGLSDEEILSMLEDMRALAREKSGSPVLYEIIEMGKDCLTEGNIPHCPCAICLDHFVEGDAFAKTSCYHYFHKACLWSYLQHAQQQTEEANIEAVAHQQEPQPFKLVCPTCRVELEEIDEDDLEAAPPPIGQQEASALTPEVRKLQAKMAALFQEQRKRGGIIDLEAERSKYLVSADTVVVLNHDADPKSFLALEKDKDSSKGKDSPRDKINESAPSRSSQGPPSRDVREPGHNRGQDNRRHWGKSGYRGENYDRGNRDYYSYSDRNAWKWQDEQSRPHSRQNNGQRRRGRDRETHQGERFRQNDGRTAALSSHTQDSHVEDTDDGHPVNDKENVRDRNLNREASAPSEPTADHGSEGKGMYRGGDGRGSGRNQRDGRNWRRPHQDRHGAEWRQDRPQSGDKPASERPEGVNRNRNRPEHAEPKLDSPSARSQKMKSSSKDDLSAQPASKQDARDSKDGTTSPRQETSEATPGKDVDGAQDDKSNRQGQQRRRRGGRRNRGASDHDDENYNEHFDVDADPERKAHPREFHRRRNQADAAPNSEVKSQGQEEHEKKGDRGHETKQGRDSAQPRDGRGAEKGSKSQGREDQRKTRDDRGYWNPRDSRNSYQRHNSYDDEHYYEPKPYRHEYHGRGRGPFKRRGARDHADYYPHGGHDDGQRQDRGGPESSGHPREERRHEPDLNGAGNRGRGHYRREYGRWRGDRHESHNSDEASSPRERLVGDSRASSGRDGGDRRGGNRGRRQTENPAGRGKRNTDATEGSSTAPPGFHATEKSRDDQPSRPPGFASAPAAASEMRLPPGFHGCGGLKPPPGFSVAESVSPD